MTNKINTEELLDSTSIVSVVEKHVALTKKGPEWLGICPFHNDTHKSLQVNETKGLFKCFACGAGGDSIAFLMQLGATFKEAVAEISGDVAAAPRVARKREAKEAKRVEWKQVIPGPETPQPDLRHYRYGLPAKSWAYNTPDGHVMGYICRFDPVGESKQVLPFIYATDGTRTEWRWQGFDRPRPLYNLHDLAARPDVTVMLVEGEKTADAAQALYPHVVVTTWQGGADGIGAADFSPLYGRKLIFWPDHDYKHRYGEKHEKAGQLKPFQEQPGNKAMLTIASILREQCPTMKWVLNPQDTPNGWDLADPDWTPEYALLYVRANLRGVPTAGEIIELPPSEEQPQQAPEMPPIPEPLYELPPIPDLPPDLPEMGPVAEEEFPFRFLGFTNTGGSLKHNLMAFGSRTVISLSASSLNKFRLMELAPLNFWERTFPKKGGADWDACADWMIATSLRKGMFSERYIRGRGAWVDGNDVVIHSGDKLVVNGKKMELYEHGSRYIYENQEPLGFNTVDPLSADESVKLMDVLNLLNWEREINSYLLAGWCVVAPVCGALFWRPHIWLTGAAGTGKSWVFHNIVRRLLGETGLAVQGETSEPGLRQVLQHDARPIVFDEAEGEDRRNQDRVQAVLGLMRAASAEDGGIMAKGTSGGQAKTYRIRSCFAFASIAVQVAQQSDRSRVTILGLKKNNGADRETRWKELQKRYHDTITNEYVRRLQARTIHLLPVILDNARTFATAAAMELGEQRTGDQLGALLAGAYSLYSTKRISLEQAVTWVQSKNWDEERSLDKSRDELMLLAHLAEQIVTVDQKYQKVERSVGELIGIAAGRVQDSGDVSPDAALSRLKRIGFKLDGDFLYVSNTADWIRNKLRDTAWAKNHNKILLRVEHARAIESTRFASGMQTRAVAVPLSVFIENY